jgi:hypothetical protein
MSLATFWAIFSQTHLVTLTSNYVHILYVKMEFIIKPKELRHITNSFEGNINGEIQNVLKVPRILDFNVNLKC